jgi:hypothetical protein
MPLKVHPGIGIARVGDSPEFFVGPETVDLPDTPPGGYRDDELRIRRQAGRFRLFDHPGGGAFAPIVDSATTTIEWSVTLRQRPMGSPTGSATVSGSNASAMIVAGGVTLGEIRTDADGHLLVLSAEINAGSFDGRCDGPVSATLTRDLGGGNTSVETAVSSWVSIVPPDFAPGRYPKAPYLFSMLDYFVTLGTATAPPDGVNVSFRRAVYPMIRGRSDLSAADLLALDAAGLMSTPLVGSSGTVMDGAYVDALIDRFRQGEFTNDFATPVPLEPDELDRGPLCHIDTDGGIAGWELGKAPLTSMVTHVVGELRFATIAFGQTLVYYSDWRTDLPACTGGISEWVTPTESPATPPGFGKDWELRGFMLREPAGLSYEEWAPRAELLTAALDFGAVPRGSGVARAIEVDLAGFYESELALNFTVLPGGFSVLHDAEFTGVVPEAGLQKGLWVFFRAELDAPLGPVSTSLTLEIRGTPHVIPLTADVVAGDTVQIGLVLDCSGSMTGDRGDGLSKFQGLKDAVGVLVEVARPGDGVAVAPFSDDAILPTHIGHAFGDASDPQRTAVTDYVAALATQNLTSIGDGLVSIETTLANTPDSFDGNAIIVVTDGMETAPLWVSDVGGLIDSRSFAVGIGIGGSGGNIDDATLQDLTAGHDGYLLLTGDAIAGENRYRLEKYLLQIFAGTTNEAVVLDPAGSIPPGGVVRIPIPVTEAEFRVDAIVVSDQASRLVLELEGPDGTRRTFESLAGMPGSHIVRKPRVGMARVPMPLKFGSGTAWGPGTWHLMISHGKEIPASAAVGAAHGGSLATAARQRNPAISYAAIVNARSSIQLDAQVSAGTTRDACFMLEARASFAGAPLPREASVHATITTPAGGQIGLPLAAAEQGRFVAHFDTAAPGLHTILFRAIGHSPAGHRFVRETTRTTALRSPDACCRKRRTVEDLRQARAAGSWWQRLLAVLCRLLGYRRA